MNIQVKKARILEILLKKSIFFIENTKDFGISQTMTLKTLVSLFQKLNNIIDWANRSILYYDK